MIRSTPSHTVNACLESADRDMIKKQGLYLSSDQDGPDEKRKGRIDDHANCDGSGPCNPAHSKPDGLDLPFDFDEAASRVDPSADEKWNR